jgi:hypothetical protein
MHDKNLGQVQRGRCYGDRRLPGRSAVSDLLYTMPKHSSKSSLDRGLESLNLRRRTEQ